MPPAGRSLYRAPVFILRHETYGSFGDAFTEQQAPSAVVVDVFIKPGFLLNTYLLSRPLSPTPILPPNRPRLIIVRERPGIW
jgi:hypothetical protein